MHLKWKKRQKLLFEFIWKTSYQKTFSFEHHSFKTFLAKTICIQKNWRIDQQKIQNPTENPNFHATQFNILNKALINPFIPNVPSFHWTNPRNSVVYKFIIWSQLVQKFLLRMKKHKLWIKFVFLLFSIQTKYFLLTSWNPRPHHTSLKTRKKPGGLQKTTGNLRPIFQFLHELGSLCGCRS